MKTPFLASQPAPKRGFLAVEIAARPAKLKTLWEGRVFSFAGLMGEAREKEGNG
jgi:hypothetical protein